MNCKQCGIEVDERRAWMLIGPDDHVCYFDKLDCLRELLGPDRPLLRAIEKGKNLAPAPQHIVVAHPEERCAHGMRAAYCYFCRPTARFSDAQ